MCKCLITSVAGHELSEKYRSSLRRQDVRTKEIDKIDMLQCFRPGDIILARIVSECCLSTLDTLEFLI